MPAPERTSTSALRLLSIAAALLLQPSPGLDTTTVPSLSSMAVENAAPLAAPIELARVVGDFQHKDGASALQPNPPRWPSSVLVFSPEDPAARIEAAVAAHTKHLWDSGGHYSSDRYALLFKPGTYHASVQVGYYVQVMGLGERPSDVKFIPEEKSGGHYLGVYSVAADPTGSGSLDTFWRVAENFFTSPRGYADDVPSALSDHMTWAVSQAAPLRRVHTDKDLWLFQLHGNGFDSLWSSGGFMANVVTDGKLIAGSQQQFMVRNCEFKGNVDADSSPGGAWSLVFSGCKGGLHPPAARDAKVVYTILPKTVISAEKPFITYNTARGKYYLQVPRLRRDSAGADFEPSSNDVIPFEKVFVAAPGSLETGELQAALDAKLSVVLSPGIYNLTKPLVLRSDNQVVLGLGLATLVAPIDGSGPCVQVLKNTFGVRLSGVMLQASAIPTPESAVFARPGSSLIDWGIDASGEPSDHDAARMEVAAANPSFMHDIFARIGGPDDDTSVNVETILRISSSYVIGDNLWLWRADHSKLKPHETPRPNQKYHLTETKFHEENGSIAYVEARCSTGLHVRGSHVTVNGLAVEHVQKNQVIWEGDHGRTVFYQSELPYDVRQDTFVNPATHTTYVGYHVDQGVENHELHGPGIYSYFRDHTVYVNTAITAPTHKAGVRISNPFTVHLNGNRGIMSILNGDTSAIDAAIPKSQPVRP